MIWGVTMIWVHCQWGYDVPYNCFEVYTVGSDYRLIGLITVG
jgi:hypothetical protein